MKQFIFLAFMTLLCSFAAWFHPIWGVLLYYGLAMLRPQFLWDWALPVELRWSLISAAIVLLSTALRLPRLLHAGRINLIMLLMVAFGVCIGMACLTAYDPGTAQQWAVEYAKVLLIAVITGLICDHVRQVRWIAMTIFLCIGYVAWDVNVKYLAHNRLDIWHRGFGGLDNNGAAIQLAMILPLAYVFIVTAKRRWQQLSALFIGLLTVHAVMLTYSRGAMLASILGLGWLMAHHRPRWHAVGTVLAITLVVALLAGPEVRSRFTSTANYKEDASAQSRFEGWAAAWRIIAEHPVSGTGLRNSNAFTHNFGADRVGRTIHSQYLQIGADTGLPALMIYGTMMALTLVRFTRARRMAQQYLAQHEDEPGDLTDEMRAQAALALAMQASMIMFCFGALFLALEVFELPWLWMAMAGVMPVLLRQAIGESSPTPKPRPMPSRTRREALA